ncbi:MAG: hypothetical protein OXI87_06190 [Albidovulum sp.]|nr:hypothetical protein [Albidovulum sp.]MDE0304461.1 hypothetical protein [Albidovulum sp.]MDE0533245.1 hypothetical protein [Albidovulum sp.]
MANWSNFDYFKVVLQYFHFANAKYVLAFPLILAACRYEPLPPEVEPKTPEEEKREQYYDILGNTNVILYGDVIGYSDESDEITRTRTRCKDDICSSGLVVFIDARDFNIEGLDIDLQGMQNGVDVVVESRKYPSGSSTIVYGGWLNYSFFGSQTDKPNHPLDPYQGDTIIASYALGYSSGENPSMTDGSAKWFGIMFGRDVSDSRARGRALQGDAEVIVDFQDDSATASVKFSNIEGIRFRANYNNMEWRELEIDQGSFGRRVGAGNYISGQFFGPEEQEVGGIFERNDIAGAFGGVRETP